MDNRPKQRDVEKRDIPPFLEKILALDVEWTKKFVSFSLNFVTVRSLKTHCKFLEVRKFVFIQILITKFQ